MAAVIPRHVLCVLGEWGYFEAVEAIVRPTQRLEGPSMGLWTSDCDPFEMTITGDLQAALDRARSEITSAGGSFSGDSSSGSFSGPTPVGSVEGKYTVRGNVVTVKITSRPRIASCDTIAERVRGFFA